MHTTDIEQSAPPLTTEMKRLLVLAAPIILAMVSRMLMGFVDFVMVSRLGTDATAAISPSTILVFTVLVIGMGAASSIQTFASQSMGRKRPQDAAAYAWQSFYAGAMFLVAGGLLTLFVEPFWALVGHPPAVQTLEVAYCRIAFWCMGFSVVSGGLEGFFNGIQKPKVSLAAVLVALLFNVAANYCLIFGNFGFPAMGVSGAAVATVIAWGVRAAMLTIVFLSPQFRRRFHTTEAWRPSGERLRGILTVGGPTSVQWFLDIGAWFVFLTWLIADFGTETLAAANIGLQYMHASFMPAIGLGVALCTRVGHSIGEGKPDLAVRQAKAAAILTGTYMGTIGLVFLFARFPLLRILSDDEAVVRLGAGVLIWAAVFQVFDALCITYINALRGAGDTRWPAIVVALHCWIIFILGGYAVSRGIPEMGHHGPWMTCTLYIMLLGVVLRQRFANGSWRKIDLFKRQDSGIPAVAVDGGPLESEPVPLAITTEQADPSREP